MPGSLVAILSHAVIDEVHVPARPGPVVEVGGAGSYAAVGASLASCRYRSLIVSGVGAADREALSTWFEMREVDPHGLFDVGEFSPRTVIQYDESGERVESSALGSAHFDAHTPLPRHIPDLNAVAAAYLFHDTEPTYWDEVEEFRTSFSGPIVWELSAASAQPDRLLAVRRARANVDALSINRAEALALFEVRSVSEAVDGLRALGGLSLLRLGLDGSLVIGATAEPLWIAAVPTTVVDPTGGGNSYTGAFLAAWADSGDADLAARIASSVAASVIGQYGAPRVDAELRSQIASDAAQLRPDTQGSIPSSGEWTERQDSHDG